MKNLLIFPGYLVFLLLFSCCMDRDQHELPNILFCISDDQSWLHTGAMGDPIVKTPAFDRIAREGILFTNAFCDAPSCGPSRAAILTGQHIWRLEEAGNIHSRLPEKFPRYTDLLEEAGYIIGSDGKGWAPGMFRTDTGWVHSSQSRMNPAGKHFRDFKEFFQTKPENKPFCFWLGSYDAHRPYQLNSGLESGMDPSKVIVPGHLPDNPVVRNDILDYYYEVQRWDSVVWDAISILRQAGELENTLVVITSDNGMPFPRAKATLYDFGAHMPLAICWPGGIVNPGRKYDGFVHLSDLAATFLEAAGLEVPGEMTAESLMDVFSEPDRWPAGDPDAKNCARAIPFGEVGSSPTKTLLMQNREGYRKLYELAFGKRPAEELYDLRADPGQMNNVAGVPEYSEILDELSARLQKYTAETGDPRALGKDAPWDFYPYYGLRINKDWHVEKRTD
jgi:N-sulfoglucosamine sulfohydrolase